MALVMSVTIGQQVLVRPSCFSVREGHQARHWRGSIASCRRLKVSAALQQEGGGESESQAAPPGFATRSGKELQPLRFTKNTLPVRLLLALSAGATLFLLRRGRGKGAMKGPPPLPDPRKIDAHVHVWAPAEEAARFPYKPGQQPTLAAGADLLLAAMADAGVDGALVVQPINHGFDHSYLATILRRYPQTLVGCCLADPTRGLVGVEELQRLVEEDGFRAVRFNPYLWPEGRKMTDAVGKALFSKAGELGIPVGFMCFKGLMLHVDEIEELCTQFPATPVLLDHLGFCKPPSDVAEEEAWSRLLGLARFPQLYVKASAFFRVSRDEFPYRDTWPLLRKLLDVYGAQRVMWGTDFPFVEPACGYGKAWAILSAEDGLFSKEELQWMFGGTIETLFEVQWGGRIRVPFGGEWAQRLVAP